MDDPVSRGVPSTLDLEVQWYARDLFCSGSLQKTELCKTGGRAGLAFSEDIVEEPTLTRSEAW